MNCYYIRTKNKRHFIIEADTTQQAMNEVSQERTFTCPWTKTTLFVEPALSVEYCERLSKTEADEEKKPTSRKKPNSLTKTK